MAWWQVRRVKPWGLGPIASGEEFSCPAQAYRPAGLTTGAASVLWPGPPGVNSEPFCLGVFGYPVVCPDAMGVPSLQVDLAISTIEPREPVRQTRGSSRFQP